MATLTLDTRGARYRSNRRARGSAYVESTGLPYGATICISGAPNGAAYRLHLTEEEAAAIAKALAPPPITG